MKPPNKMNVLDKHNGYTSIRRVSQWTGFDKALGQHVKKPCWSGTCWHPGNRLPTPIGTLVEYKEDSFYQSNNNCTRAIYRIGRRYTCVWFDNQTHKRVA